MKVGLVSDLHLEFHRDGGGSLVASLGKDCDVLVAAGDIAVGAGIQGALRLLCRAFRHVLYLHGNHEFYGTTWERVQAETARARAVCPNLDVLEPGKVVSIEGQRFLGGTLWFPKHPSAPHRGLNDFNLIKGFESWVYRENRAAVAFLEEETQPGDVVVTHHLPSSRSTPPAFEHSSLNPFFVCDMERVIRAKTPKLWLHGHTHTSCDYVIDKTRVVCNPFGYPHEINDRFDPNLVLEVEPDAGTP